MQSRTSHEMRSLHTHPVYHAELDLMLSADNDYSAIIPSDGIDHIMVKNGEGIDFSFFGTVADEYTVSASDHYPVFADFTV